MGELCVSERVSICESAKQIHHNTRTRVTITSIHALALYWIEHKMGTKGTILDGHQRIGQNENGDTSKFEFGIRSCQVSYCCVYWLVSFCPFSSIRWMAMCSLPATSPYNCIVNYKQRFIVFYVLSPNHVSHWFSVASCCELLCFETDVVHFTF